MADCGDLISNTDLQNYKKAAENVQDAAGSKENTYTPWDNSADQLTLTGVANRAQSSVDAVIYDVGHKPVGTFEIGAVVENAQETLTYDSKEWNNTAGPYPVTVDGATPDLDSHQWYVVSSVSELQAALRGVNARDDQGILSTDKETEIPEYIYYVEGQVLYSVPDAAQGKFVQSVSGGVLETSDGESYALLRSETKNKTITLSSSGVSEGDDATNKIIEFFRTMEASNQYAIDVSCTYSATTAIEKTVSDVSIEWLAGKVITTPDLDQDTNQAFLKLSGEFIQELTATRDVVKYDKYLTFTSIDGVAVGDMLFITTDIYFNGIDGVGGSGIVNQREVCLVRDISDANNGLLFDACFEFDTPIANVVKIEHWRPVRNITLTNVNVTGQGVNGNEKENGTGSMGVVLEATVDCLIDGGELLAHQNRAVGIYKGYRVDVKNAHFDSLNGALLEQGFYGVVHEASRFCNVEHCTGNNIRRVADTSGGGLDVLSSDIGHFHLTGTNMNGSCCGTHACYNYSWGDIICDGYSLGGMTLRGVNTEGDGLRVLGDAGIGIFVGMSNDEDESAGTTSGIVNIKNVYVDSEVTNAVQVKNDGEFDIHLVSKFSHTAAVTIKTDKLTSLKLRGKCESAQSELGAVVVNFHEHTADYGKIDLSEISFDANHAADIYVNGSADAESPFGELIIENNDLSSTDMPVVFGNGYFRGETTRIKGNKSTNGSGTSVIDLGNPYQWSCRPEFVGNVRQNTGYLDQYKRIETDVCIGQFDELTDIPDGTTILGGDKILIKAGSGEACEYKAPSGGTTGVIAGVTGTVIAGSNELALVGNTVDKVYKGCFVTLVGASALGNDVKAKVRAVSADLATAELVVAAGTTVSDFAVTYSNPTLTATRTL